VNGVLCRHGYKFSFRQTRYKYVERDIRCDKRRLFGQGSGHSFGVALELNPDFGFGQIGQPACIVDEIRYSDVRKF
jgi:hypothetical protein